MGCYLARPVTDKDVHDVDEKGLRVGACSMQGWRTGQEDAHSIEINLTPDVSLFAVFDGHGGPEVAEWSSKALPQLIAQQLQKQSDLSQFSATLQELFIQHDESILSDAVIAELHAIAGRDIPQTEKSEMQDELEELEADNELTHEQLLAKYGVNKDEYEHQKAEIANMVLSQWAQLKEGDDEDDEDDDEEDEEETTKSETSSKSLNQPTATVSGSGDYEPEKKRKRVMTAEERAKNLEAANDENGCGGIVLEDHSDASSEHSTDDEENAKANENSPLFRAEDAEICGHDSGTTCILTLYQKNTGELLVGNIGDSRGVLCRAGLAVDLSYDHKPEDDIELTRIKKAGGYLTGDGRVKGGLNLSRAFGDHIYKDNSSIPLKEQMITAFPDVKYMKVTNEDEFMILACDGIWNVMTSQECVDFVRDRLEKDSCISDILGELFDQCIAPDSQGDGSGCDNMTCIVVQLRPRVAGSKRPTSDEELAETDDGKQLKTNGSS